MATSSRQPVSAVEVEQWNLEALRRNCKYIILMYERYLFRIFPDYVQDDVHLKKLKVKHALADEESRKFLSVVCILTVGTSTNDVPCCNTKKRKR